MIKVENVVCPSPEQWQAVVRGVRNPLSSWDKSDSGYCINLNMDLHSWLDHDNKLCQSCPHACFENGEYDGCKGYEGQEVKDYKEEGNYGCQYILGEKDLKLMTNLANAGPDHGKFLRQLPLICEVTAPFYWYKQLDQYKIGTVTNSCSTMHTLTKKEFEMSDFSIVHPEAYWSNTIHYLNQLRQLFLETKDKEYWQKIVEALPENYMQKRTLSLNYAVLKNMYHQRKNHKLSEWPDFLKAFEDIPYYKELIVGELSN